MDSIIQILQPYIADETSLRIVVMLLAALTFVGLSVGIGYVLFSAFDPMRRRLGAVANERIAAGANEIPTGGMVLNVDGFLGPIAQYVLPQEDLERNSMQAKLTHAGFRKPNALPLYYAIKTSLALGLPIITFAACQFFPQLTQYEVLMCSLTASAVGLFGPNFVLNRAYEKRQKLLRDGFPDALDLLVVCVEAGLGLAQAIKRVADELSVSHPELATDMALVNAETRAGVDRIVALKNLSSRTGLEDIQGLVSLLVQTLRFGTGIADSLRVYSEEYRDKRMQAAEEQAAKIGTKMIFPLVFFMFPAFFVVAAGPSVIRLMDAFSQMGTSP